MDQGHHDHHRPGRHLLHPTLLRLVASGQVNVKRFFTHHFGLDEFDEAYDVFGRAADTGALKVVLTRTDDE